MSEQTASHLDPRLQRIAAQVRPGAVFADIGCDHGLLSIELVRQGAQKGYACDIKPGPLQAAQKNIERAGFTGRLQTRLTDGLDGLEDCGLTDIIIAGMGGDNIASILDAAAWVHDPRYTLILQPQTSGNDLRRYLGRAGFSIEAEALVRDGGFLYFTILARFGGGTPLTPGQQYLSPQLLRSGDPLLPAYFDRILNALERTVAGITAGGDEKKLDYYQRALDEVREMRRQYDGT